MWIPTRGNSPEYIEGYSNGVKRGKRTAYIVSVVVVAVLTFVLTHYHVIKF